MNDGPTFTSPPSGQGGAVPAATTNRRLLIVLAAIGIVAGLVGIGASIAGVDDDRDQGPATTTTTGAAVTRAEAEAIALAEVPGTVDRARREDEGWEVRIDAEDGHVDVLVDATTGAVLEVDD